MPERTSETRASGAEPDSIEKIENEWKQLKATFQMAMPRSHKVIYLIHEGRQFITMDQATDIVAEIVSVNKRTPIDLILHTRGGSAAASDMIAHALVKRPNTRAFVPFFATSGGTEIALATGKVVFGKHAFLGPTNVLIDGYSLDEIKQLEDEVGLDKLDDYTKLLVIRARGLKDRDIAAICRLINRRHMTWSNWFFDRCKLARVLSGEMRHDHRIHLKEARKLGIRAKGKAPRSMYALVSARRDQLKRQIKLEGAIRVVSASDHDKNAPKESPNQYISERDGLSA